MKTYPPLLLRPSKIPTLSCPHLHPPKTIAMQNINYAGTVVTSVEQEAVKTPTLSCPHLHPPIIHSGIVVTPVRLEVAALFYHHQAYRHQVCLSKHCPVANRT